MRSQADERQERVYRWNRVWKRNPNVSAHKHTGLTEVSHTLRKIREVRETDLRYEEQGVAWVGLMQNVSADADDTPGERGERQKCDYVNPKSPVYIRIGLTPKFYIVIFKGGTFLSVQLITPFQKSSRGCSLRMAKY
jgi:hypothetical protein